MGVLRNLFVTRRFFYGWGVLILLMTLSHPFELLFPLAQASLVVFAVVCLVDGFLLFNKQLQVRAERQAASILSLGDDNPIDLLLTSSAGIRLSVEVIDELPEQFQIRDFAVKLTLGPFASTRHRYFLRPVVRGEYVFGSIHVYVSSVLGILRRRISHGEETRIPVYPSVIQMRKYELSTIARTASEYGVKKVRRIGHSYEFEHIKPYQRGDDYRSVNWKATGRRGDLMVNQYEDERSQQVYCLIDKSRVMHMPFNGLSLFGYAVNASLVISNIVLGKQDKAGLITFAERPKTVIKADRRKAQLRKILEALYKESERAVEANYESMYMAVRKVVSSRSLLFLYTNFESTYALQRVLPQLRKLNTHHLLVVVFFENTEITAQTSSVDTLEDIYTQITAEQYLLSKVQIAQQLKQFGIFSLLTRPENLTVNAINKYLELKSRGMI